MNLPRALKLRRTIIGLKLAEVASRAGLSVSYLSLLEAGKRCPPFSVIGRLALALDCSLVTLVFLASDENDLAGISREVQEKLAAQALAGPKINRQSL